jgi:hypothetical protein
MALNFNIPLPGVGLDSFTKGFGLTDNLMRQILERHELAQKKEQFEKELELKNRQENRLGANSDLTRDILKEQLLGLKHKNDPNYEWEQFQRMFGGGQTAPTSLPQGDQYPALKKLFAGQGVFPEGEIEHGNINLANRPQVQNPETGGISTVYSTSIGTPKGEVLIPRVSENGDRILSEKEAEEQYHKTGHHLGIYSSPEEATRAAEAIHQQQAASVGALPGQNLLDVLRNNPIKRAFFKHKYKFDPLGVAKEDVLHGPARDASDLKKLKEKEGEDSEVYKNAKAAYDANLEQKKDLRDLRERTKQGLKPGEKLFYDAQSGEPAGKEIPLTAKEREAEEGNIMFNELYPYVYKGGAPFSGEGSITRLQNAAAHYKTDPKARKMFDNLLLSDKMLAATTVNEASTLKAGKTNTTYKMLKESLEAQDVPRIIKKLIKEYNIPASAQLRAGMRYQKLLSEARNKARKGTPATQKLYFDPEKQAANEKKIAESGIAPKESSSIIVIDPNGKKFKTTKANAAHLPKGWQRG